MGDIAFVIVFIGVISLRFQNAFQRELLEKTEEAETDLLTGVYNIRYLQNGSTPSVRRQPALRVSVPSYSQTLMD